MWVIPGGEMFKLSSLFGRSKEHAPHDPVAVTSGPKGLDRSVFDDAARVKAEIANLPPKIFKQMKQAALANPTIKADIKGSQEDGYYGSHQHKEYGAYVAMLTGNAITAEEAMRMNPSGGIAGPGLKGIAFESGPLHEHAIRHDATGFLLTFFSIGPGYGGDVPDSPLSGQVEGLKREILRGQSELPGTEGVGAPLEDEQRKQQER